MHFSLRLKLTLVSLIFLASPLIGLRFGAILKSELLKSREETLMLTARAVSTTLSNRPDLFNRELFQSVDQSRDVYAFDLSGPIHLNGESGDWFPHIKQSQFFSTENILFTTIPYKQNSFSFKHLLGKWGNHLYALFIVQDDYVVYRDKRFLNVENCDHLQIGIVDKEGKFNRYLVATDKPGWVNGYLETEGNYHYYPVKNENRIQGFWKETKEGYILEIRLPLAFISRKLGFALADVDDANKREVTTLIGTSNTQRSEELGWLLARSPAIEKILKSFNKPQARIWVVDNGRRVRGRFGNLQTNSQNVIVSHDWWQPLTLFLHKTLQPFYGIFMESYVSDFSDPTGQPAKLDLQGIEEGLLGKSSLQKYHIADGKVEVLAAISPLLNNREVIGAVVVEQTINSILAMKNRVVEESIDITILAFLLGGFILLFFATRLSSRIVKVHNQASAALSPDGRIIDTIHPMRARDEIGDLSRTLAEMLTQLRQQSEYREKMADNLEHEMRTPLAGVSASLKNLSVEAGLSPTCQDYVDWAIKDVRRLEELLTTIRDATTLKNALIHDFPEHFDLCEAVQLWLEHSWQTVFPNESFHFDRPTIKLPIFADPERIKQLLDKLVENAVDFKTPKTQVTISLLKSKQYVEIKIINQGPELDPAIQTQIFNSMVSLRQNQTNKPHLGLGLYIVRNIVEHYKGTVTATSLDSPFKGVVFTILLPLSSEIKP